MKNTFGILIRLKCALISTTASSNHRDCVSKYLHIAFASNHMVSWSMTETVKSLKVIKVESSTSVFSDFLYLSVLMNASNSLICLWKYLLCSQTFVWLISMVVGTHLRVEYLYTKWTSGYIGHTWNKKPSRMNNHRLKTNITDVEENVCSRNKRFIRFSHLFMFPENCGGKALQDN